MNSISSSCDFAKIFMEQIRSSTSCDDKHFFKLLHQTTLLNATILVSLNYYIPLQAADGFFHCVLSSESYSDQLPFSVSSTSKLPQGKIKSNDRSLPIMFEFTISGLRLQREITSRNSKETLLIPCTYASRPRRTEEPKIYDRKFQSLVLMLAVLLSIIFG